MKQFLTIRDAIINVSDSKKGITYYENGMETKRTYQEVFQRSGAILTTMYDFGIKRGDTLLLQINGFENFIATIWACILGEIVAVPYNLAKTDADFELIKDLDNKFENLYIITDDSDEKLLDELHNRTLNINEHDLSQAISPKELINNNKSVETDTLFILFSSGSTGAPKGVSFSSKKLFEQFEYFNKTFAITEEDRFLNWMPLSHIFGLAIFNLLPMTINAEQYLISTMDYIYDPTLWSKKIFSFNATILSSSNFGVKYFMENITKNNEEDFNFNSVRALVIASDMISKLISEQFIETMNKFGFKRNAFCPAYGMTEATVFVSYNTPYDDYEWVSIDRNAIKVGKEIKYVDENEKESSVFINVGNILNAFEVRIVAEDNSILENEKIGHLQIKGECVLSEYFHDTETTTAAFTEEGWFITGDMGFIKDNKLIITGRYKDMIICNGKNYYAEDLENVVISIPEVLNSIAFGVFDHTKMEEKIVLFIKKQEVAEDKNVIRDVRTVLGIKMGLNINEIYFTNTIPITRTGKKRRNELKKEYLNNISIENDDANLSNSIEFIDDKDILEIWMKVLQLENINDNTNFFELGGNSIKAIQLVEEVNRKFQMNLKVKSIFKNPLFSNFKSYVKEFS